MLRWVLSKQRHDVFGLLLLLGVFFVAACYSDEDCPSVNGVILSGDINVTATCKCRAFEDSDEDHYEIYDCEIAVERNGKMYVTQYEFREGDGDKDPISAIKSQTNWKDGFLFVPSYCGTGNMWRCGVNYVFIVKGGELACLGSVTGFDRGFFYDVYDGLERNELTSHASAPCFFLLMTEQNGTLVADLERTWELNRNSYDSHMDDIERCLEKTGGEPDSSDEVVSSLLYSTALARYCDREKELEKMLSMAKRILSAANLDVFRKLIDCVVPGDTHKCCQPKSVQNRINLH